MRNTKRSGYALLIFLLGQGVSTLCYAGGRTGSDSLSRGNYSIVLYTGGGMSYYSTRAGVPEHLETDLDKVKPAATLRILWHPDRRLSIGAESGWISMYSYRLLNSRVPGSLRLTSIPLLLCFSMPVTRCFRLSVGAGYYFETMHLSYAGEVVTKTVSPGWMAAGSYSFLTLGKLALAAEIKWLNASKSEQAILCAQLQLAWKIISW